MKRDLGRDHALAALLRIARMGQAEGWKSRDASGEGFMPFFDPSPFERRLRSIGDHPCDYHDHGHAEGLDDAAKEARKCLDGLGVEWREGS